MNKRIIHIDASSLRDSSCFRSFWFTVIGGYREQTKFLDTEFGQAVHTFAKEYYLGLAKGEDQMIAERLALKQAKEQLANMLDTYDVINRKKPHLRNPTMLTKACMTVAEYINDDTFSPLIVDDKPLIEMKFSIPWYEDDNIAIMLSGTIDKIGKIQNGCYAIGDWKVTSFNYLRDKTLAAYKLDPQLIFYVFILNELAIRYPDSIFQKMLQQGRIGCFIDGVFLTSPSSEKAGNLVEVLRSEVFLPKARDLLEVRHHIETVVDKILLYSKINKTPLREGIYNGSCKKIVPCKYSAVCGSPDEISEKHILNNNFKQAPYDPLNFN